MKITVFTSDQPRHRSLVNKISTEVSECYAIIEKTSHHPGVESNTYGNSQLMRDYFKHVQTAERKFFHEEVIHSKSLSIEMGSINNLEHRDIKSYLSSDIYLVFGSSYIKGWLADVLFKNDAINIHLGIAPFYRGSSCNFWAIYDNNPHLVGATVHKLAKKLDSGDLLLNAYPTVDNCQNIFEFSMKSVVSIQDKLLKSISEGLIREIDSTPQDPNTEIRYSKKAEFTEDVVKEYYQKNLNIETIEAKQ